MHSDSIEDQPEETSAGIKRSRFPSRRLALLGAMLVPVLTIGPFTYHDATSHDRPLGAGLAQTALIWGVAEDDSLRSSDSLRIADSLAIAALNKGELGAPSVVVHDEAGDALEEVEQDVAVVEEVATGPASYYGSELAGRRTASGERFDPSELTAAHRTLPFGSRVRVTNLKNGQSVVVRINDRGPFAKRRVIDVSRAAAQQIGMVRSGVARVRVELLGRE